MNRKAMDNVIDHQTAGARTYDAVVVGAGVSGAIIAKQLSLQGFSVLVVEAGQGGDLSVQGYERYLDTFYSSVAKDNNAPFPRNPDAPMVRSTDVERLELGKPNTGSYLVQNGPFVTDSSYTRVVGGTTMHWEAKTPRMLADDFQMKTRYDQGLDWPITYEELMPFYRKAEAELGVSGDVEGQRRIGVEFSTGYVYPMQEMPPSFLDRAVARRVNGTRVDLEGETHTLHLETYPQARNGIPNEKYRGFNEGELFSPVGAVSQHQADGGGRCQGNTNCTPLCPVQAKYDARRTLAQALDTGRVDLLGQSVASRVCVDSETGRVTGIECKTYFDPNASEHVTTTVRGRVFVLAAHAIENARLMLASGLNGSGDLMGRYLMDHPYLLAWGLMPEVTGTMRGTICTSGISNLRRGAFRRTQAAFAVDIHNDGWGWATGGAATNLVDIVDNLNKYGAALQKELVSQISRQLLLAFMVELPAMAGNRVTVDPQYTDQLGNMRPVISFSIPDYSMNGIAFARSLSKRIFQRIGVEDHTSYDPLDPGYISYDGKGYAIRGGNHLAGTHVMGTSKENSVVDSHQRSWEHENLYLAGPGSMPTIGTSNTTLTLTALCLRSVESIGAAIRKASAPAAC